MRTLDSTHIKFRTMLLWLVFVCMLALIVAPRSSFGQDASQSETAPQTEDLRISAAQVRALLDEAYISSEHLSNAEIICSKLDGFEPHHQELTQKARELSEGAESERACAQAIHDWLTTMILPAQATIPDPLDSDGETPADMSQYDNPYFAYENSQASSRGFAELCRLMYQELDIATLILKDSSNETARYWNAAYLDGRWEFIDASADAQAKLETTTEEVQEQSPSYFCMEDATHDANYSPAFVQDFTGDIDEYPVSLAQAKSVKLYSEIGKLDVSALAVGAFDDAQEGVIRRLPQPSAQDASFDGWYTEAQGGQEVSEYSHWLCGENTSLYAHWTYPIDICDVLEIADTTYDAGNALCPEPVLTHGEKTLQREQDYRLTYANNIECGQATITIEGINNYTGQITKTFKIVPADISQAQAQVPSVLYDGSAQKPPCVLSYKGQTLVEGKDFRCSYSNNINAGRAQIVITGLGNYTSQKILSFTIRRQALSAIQIAQIPKQVYTGKKITPQLKLTYEGMALVQDKDFSVLFNNNQNIGTADVVLSGLGNYVGPATLSFKIVGPSKPMYRLYNPNSGEHFYTASAHERDVLKRAGWRYEGIGWYAPLTSKTPVYRLYNKNAGDHHYTTSVGEKNHLVKLGWRYEGIGWYSDDAKGVPLYRQYNPNAKAGSHNYTQSKAENDVLVSVGWRAEGIGWYGVKS